MIGAETFATPPFYIYKQAVCSLCESAKRHLLVLTPGVATLGPIKGFSIFFFFLFWWHWFELRASRLLDRHSYRLSHSTTPFL
jgi:hypothetical protein